MKRLLPFVFIAVTVAGCGTSASYKALVHRTYPVIADRMGRYPLTDQEKIEVQDLRSAAADQGKVKYETARPVWEKVEPDYRRVSVRTTRSASSAGRIGKRLRT
jgi:hypothetical protein